MGIKFYQDKDLSRLDSELIFVRRKNKKEGNIFKDEYEVIDIDLNHKEIVKALNLFIVWYFINNNSKSNNLTLKELDIVSLDKKDLSYLHKFKVDLSTSITKSYEKNNYNIYEYLSRKQNISNTNNDLVVFYKDTPYYYNSAFYVIQNYSEKDYEDFINNNSNSLAKIRSDIINEHNVSRSPDWETIFSLILIIFSFLFPLLLFFWMARIR